MTPPDPRPQSAQPKSDDPTSPGVAAAEELAVPLKPLLELRDPLPAVLEVDSALAELAARFGAGTGPFGIDAERASGYRYSQRAYLIQMRREGAGTALVDPIPFGDVPNTSMAALNDAVADTEWIIHAASQDLACLAELGLRPTTLFDTELAGRLLNYPRVGLAVLVEELLGFRMRKEHSAVDWSRRPLPEPWLVYAALDVEPLVELRDILSDQLEAAGKAEWARQEFAAWADDFEPTVRSEPWRRTSGIHRVRGRRGLALVRAMWERRDELARNRDITASRILPDAAIVAAATAAPTSRNALSRVDGFATRGAQRYLKEFAGVIATALALPDAALPSTSPQHDGPPPPRAWADKDPVAAARLTRCRTAVNELAEKHDLPQENLLTPDSVRRLAWRPPREVTPQSVAAVLTELGTRPWQVEITAGSLADALLDTSPEELR
jgi:ribonuclease D